MQNSALVMQNIPDSKVHGANMGPTWGWQDPCGPYVGPAKIVIWDVSENRVILWISAEFCGILENGLCSKELFCEIAEPINILQKPAKVCGTG